MKKTVIAVHGKSNQGKTSTIIEFFNQFQIKEKSSIRILSKYQKSKKSKDIRIILELDILIANKMITIKIGIETEGDPDSRLPESLDLFVQQQCDIIICATRTSGKTVNAVLNLENTYGYEGLWLSNLTSNQKNKNQLNSYSARILLNIFYDVIQGFI